MNVLDNRTVHVLKMNLITCCEIMAENLCECPIKFDQQRTFFEVLIRQILQIFNKNFLEKYDTSTPYNCTSDNSDLTIKNEIEMELFSILSNKYKSLRIEDGVMKMRLSGKVQTGNGINENVNIGDYDTLYGFTLNTGKEMLPIRRFYRIGTTTVPILIIKYISCNLNIFQICSH